MSQRVDLCDSGCESFSRRLDGLLDHEQQRGEEDQKGHQRIEYGRRSAIEQQRAGNAADHAGKNQREHARAAGT